ncbi:GtrA family protein [Rugosibacter aromaticivorans]|uniref:GtrA family protein n=1 Tax=Rugosibacter aromaticivorans TaxID=1565605 RepID=UPI0011FE72AC|nr:GtrA family protein [Rugosibacter aromaticivorans]TBR14096.1 MAG: GtrA family protein [Rugosibacter sp.]
MKMNFSSLLTRQFVRYLGVGGLSFAVDFAFLYYLTEYVGIHYLISASLAFCVGLTTNYLLCLAWVFDFRRMPNRWHEFMVFSAIGFIGLLLNNLLLWLLTEHAGLYYLLSKIIATAAILFFNFSLRRWLLFSPPQTPATPRGILP